jgi:predicted AAA+ superfamily ATPase
MWIERSISSRLKRLAGSRPVVVLTGARQTGKTALLRRLFPDHHYVTLDLPSEASQAEQDPVAFLKRHPTPLIVDEVQYAPSLFRHLKLEVDQDRSLNGRYLLSGSQPFALMQGVSESLAGRAAIVELGGLSSTELKQLDAPLDPLDLIQRGGFPELHANREIDPAEYMASYVATYLERDLRSLLQVNSLRDFERFLRAAALRSGQLLNRAELARDVGISNSTAGVWLSLLQRSGQAHLLEPWFANGTRQLSKSPKLYLNDSGLLSFLLGLQSPSELLNSPLLGNLWETWVVNDLLRQQQALGQRNSLYFWRDRSHEVDLVLHRGGRFWLADVKWSEQPDPRAGRPLQKVRGLLPEGAVVDCALLCRASNPYPLNGIQVLPALDAGAWLGLTPAASADPAAP